VEESSLAKSIAVALVVVYGGEAIMNPWLGLQPSFVFSPVVPAMYALLTVLVERLPSVPPSSFKTELPLSFLDGLTRAFLLCQLIPPAVTTHSMSAIAGSPWTLLLSSLITANGGFFVVGLFSMTEPTGFALATPPELRASGWTSTDLWCAPLATGLYAFLTHAQPFWAELHAMLIAWAGGSGSVVVSGSEKPVYIDAPAVDNDVARAACAVLLTALFVTKNVRKFGPAFMKEIRGEKKKTE